MVLPALEVLFFMLLIVLRGAPEWGVEEDEDFWGPYFLLASR